MATKNTMTPSGGIFQSHRGGQIGFGISPQTIQQQILEDAQKAAQHRWKIRQAIEVPIYELLQARTISMARDVGRIGGGFGEFLRR